MDANTEHIKKQVQNYIIAVLKSSALGVAKELKQLVIKVDPMMTIKQILSKLKKQLKISENDSIFLYAYGNILNGEDKVGDVFSRFQNKIGSGGSNKLELNFSQMAAFGCK